MKKVLFATGNEAKAKRFSKGLQEKGIEVITLFLLVYSKV